MSKRRHQLAHTQRAANVNIISERGAGVQFTVPEEAAKLIVFVLRYVTVMWAMAYLWRGYEWSVRQVIVWRSVFSPYGWRQDLAVMWIAFVTLPNLFLRSEL